MCSINLAALNKSCTDVGNVLKAAGDGCPGRRWEPRTRGGNLWEAGSIRGQELGGSGMQAQSQEVTPQ